MPNILPKTYDFKTREEYWRQFWDKERIYRFEGCRHAPQRVPRVGTRRRLMPTKKPIFSIDTPPPYVSASHLHVGHIMSYSQAEFIVRYKRMRGFQVFYPMGFDDNGLPTERYVEQKYQVDKSKISRSEFIKLCLKETKNGAQTYKNLWRLLGISIDWTKTYSTINQHCQRISQWSFIDLYKKNRVERREGPIMWCPHCQTALAQADLEDKKEQGGLNYIVFSICHSRLDRESKSRMDSRVKPENDKKIKSKDDKDVFEDDKMKVGTRRGACLLIATTRPELLGACVALYFNPKDKRYQHLKNKKALVPIFNYEVPILTDESVDPKFGTGLMMVCTWGDKDDIIKWQKDKLVTRILFDEQGRLTGAAGPYQGLAIKEAREKIIGDLKKQGSLKKQKPIEHTLNVHERCGTAVEFIQTKQWFIKLLDAKEAFLKRGRELKWHPKHMHQKYEDWVKNLQWDWCISRQRYFGVPFPLWYCAQCETPILAEEDRLPVDPLEEKPPVKKCSACGATQFKPETDVMDTWATSSLTPVIISTLPSLSLRGSDSGRSNPRTTVNIQGIAASPSSKTRAPRPVRNEISNRASNDSGLIPDKSLFPTTLRPQAFEIIRTWLFYTIVKSHYHHNHLPFKEVMISGHGLDNQGRKISKRLGNFEPPEKIIVQYGADALRYWATGAILGENLRYNKDEVKKGKRTVTKIFNASRFCLTHLEKFKSGNCRNAPRCVPTTEPADQWVLHHLAQVINQATTHFENYEYAKARDVIDNFFWHIFCDNYLEFIKHRVYGDAKKSAQTAKQTLFIVMLDILKLYAPFLPFITEEIYQVYFRQFEQAKSIHLSAWPQPEKSWQQGKKFLNEFDKALNLIDNIRKYKSEKNLSLGQEIAEFRADEKIPEKYLEFVQKAMGVKKILNTEY